MGLIVDIYRTAALGDCTGGGISASHDQLTLVNVSGPFEPTPDRPAALLVDGNLRGTKRIVPAVWDEDASWWTMLRLPDQVGPMMGGNYAATSDSRFRNAADLYGAVAIHDRYETPEQYARLSQ